MPPSPKVLIGSLQILKSLTSTAFPLSICMATRLQRSVILSFVFSMVVGSLTLPNLVSMLFFGCMDLVANVYFRSNGLGSLIFTLPTGLQLFLSSTRCDLPEFVIPVEKKFSTEYSSILPPRNK